MHFLPLWGREGTHFLSLDTFCLRGGVIAMTTSLHGTTFPRKLCGGDRKCLPRPWLDGTTFPRVPCGSGRKRDWWDYISQNAMLW